MSSFSLRDETKLTRKKELCRHDLKKIISRGNKNSMNCYVCKICPKENTQVLRCEICALDMCEICANRLSGKDGLCRHDLTKLYTTTKDLVRPYSSLLYGDLGAVQCSCCRQNWVGLTYRCAECEFILCQKCYINLGGDDNIFPVASFVKAKKDFKTNALCENEKMKVKKGDILEIMRIDIDGDYSVNITNRSQWKLNSWIFKIGAEEKIKIVEPEKIDLADDLAEISKMKNDANRDLVKQMQAGRVLSTHSKKDLISDHFYHRYSNSRAQILLDLFKRWHWYIISPEKKKQMMKSALMYLKSINVDLDNPGIKDLAMLQQFTDKFDLTEQQLQSLMNIIFNEDQDLIQDILKMLHEDFNKLPNESSSEGSVIHMIV